MEKTPDSNPDIQVENQSAEEQDGPMDELAAARAERDELKDRMLRMAAETENFKKRAEREKAEFLKRANESLVRDLLPVLDNLERALVSAGEGADARTMTQGVGMVYQDLKKLLERHGLEPVESVGLPFDPERHEAMMQQEDPDQEENTVLSELQKGYLFQDRLLRPAMVVVSKRPAGADDDGPAVTDKGSRIKVKVH